MSDTAGGVGGSERSYLRVLLSCTASAAVTIVAGAVLALGLTTVISSYRGESTPTWTSPVRVSVVANGCERVGPVSSYGFGYWWRCRAQVMDAEGRASEITLGASMVTPDDKNDPVALVERCSAVDRRECVYTRRGGEAAAIGIRMLHVLRLVILVISATMAVLFLLRGFLGRKPYARLVGSAAASASARKE
ncbi:DUF6346 domain-containing protein [Micromonospora psammae]|uniref:DUF6346 domain-containing protein n=1 Tax=Micromonospora sp. CPCC 205556 TaxID=3122398 RepID=UPI002FF05EA0